MKVLITEKIAKNGIEQLKAAGFDVDVKLNIAPEELKECIKDYDALIVRSGTKVTEEVISNAKNLKIIGRAGIGVDNIDVNAATKGGIIVANAPQSNIISAAEHTIALLFAQCRNIPSAHVHLKSGKWERSKFQGVEVCDKTLGIVGLGRIGTLVATRAHGLGMKVIAYDPYVSKERFEQLGVERAEKLEDLLKVSDFISVHVPKTKETTGMFGEKEFTLMKEGVRIVNTARGGIFQEKALIKALKGGKVASVAVDVFEKEPCTSSPLFEFEQVVVTPHLGASTQEAQDKAGIMIAEQIIAALKGGVVTNAVNIPVVPTEVAEALKPFLPLAEQLGNLYIHLAKGKLGHLEAEYSGEIAQRDTRLLTNSILKGLFASVVEEPITLVNAPVIAKERGVRIKESKSTISRDYINLITLRGKDAQGELSVAGTVIGKKDEPRFVGIYEYEIDIIPSKYMLFVKYIDRPGMIGAVGSTMGRANINIASMQVGRKRIRGEAVMGLNLDDPVPDHVVEQIRQIPGISDVWFIVLEGAQEKIGIIE
ncbi:MAG: phosphoglycerate dehydrogenase [Actinomycetota bacterium]|nr:phosphoglycerate dehydrogenase [Actinomycetota bacterium]